MLDQTEVKVQSLAEIVRETEKANQNFRPAGGAPTPKRGRGRPRRNGAPNKATLELLGLTSDPLSAGAAAASPDSSSSSDTSGAGSGFQQSSSGPGQADQSGAESLEITEELCKLGLQFPFTLAREATGFPGFGLDDETASQCAPLAKQCIDTYCPEVARSKHAPLFILCFTLGSVATLQYKMFAEWKKEQAEIRLKKDRDYRTEGVTDLEPVSSSPRPPGF